MLKNNNQFPISDVYKGLDSDIRYLKNKLITQFKDILQKKGFRFIAEWIDWELPILYNDVYLVEYGNLLYDIRFSAGMKKISIGTRTFTRFDTINLENGSYNRKTLMGYKINSNNTIERLESRKNHPKSKNLVYKDLLRIEKISKLLKEDELSQENKD